VSDPIILRPATGVLTLGANTFTCQVVIGLVTSEQSENVVEAMCASVVNYGKPRYFLDLDYFQDFSTGGISAYLWNAADNAEVAFTFSPQADGTPGMAGTVKLRPPATMGGEVNQAARDHVRLACTGKPTLTAGS
jgi:hypothetical protein